MFFHNRFPARCGWVRAGASEPRLRCTCRGGSSGCEVRGSAPSLHTGAARGRAEMGSPSAGHQQLSKTIPSLALESSWALEDIVSPPRCCPRRGAGEAERASHPAGCLARPPALLGAPRCVPPARVCVTLVLLPGEKRLRPCQHQHGMTAAPPPRLSPATLWLLAPSPAWLTPRLVLIPARPSASQLILLVPAGRPHAGWRMISPCM